MQLPNGKLVTSRRGPAELKEVGEAVAKDSLNGYLRVSVFDKNAVHESVIVYAAGRPVMAFVSDDGTDRRDPDYRQINEAIRMDNAIIEVCELQDKQVKLLQDLYRELAITPSPAEVPAKQAPKELPATAPVHAEKSRQVPAPEVRGRFVRAESLGGIDEYLQRHPGETGHLLFIARLNGGLEEHHIILIKGKIETAYSDRAAGPELVEQLKRTPGQAEFYAVDEALLTSILSGRARAASPLAANRHAPDRLAPRIGIPARDLLKSPWPVSSPRESITRAMGEISGGVEDDIAMMRKVEREFACHVDELLGKLDLSHLRSRKRR